MKGTSNVWKRSRKILHSVIKSLEKQEGCFPWKELHTRSGFMMKDSFIHVYRCDWPGQTHTCAHTHTYPDPPCFKAWLRYQCLSLHAAFPACWSTEKQFLLPGPWTWPHVPSSLPLWLQHWWLSNLVHSSLESTVVWLKDCGHCITPIWLKSRFCHLMWHWVLREPKST